jgi:hypothetical protein
MRGAPDLDASDVHGTGEVVGVGWLGQPGSLAGGLAHPAAIDGAAVALALTLAMVGDEKQPARQALALSRLGHRRSPTNPSSATITATEPSMGSSLKKTEGEARRRPSETVIRTKRIRKKTHVQTG